MFAGAVFWVATSALGAMVVVTLALGLVPLLLPGIKSGVIELLLAVLLIARVAVSGTVKPILRVAVVPLAIATGGNVTTPVAAL